MQTLCVFLVISICFQSHVKSHVFIFFNGLLGCYQAIGTAAPSAGSLQGWRHRLWLQFLNAAFCVFSKVLGTFSRQSNYGILLLFCHKKKNCRLMKRVMVKDQQETTWCNHFQLEVRTDSALCYLLIRTTLLTFLFVSRGSQGMEYISTTP